mgnify:CR=1 FL=1
MYINEAIRRELRRGGQVYYLHNKVETIEKTVQEVSITESDTLEAAIEKVYDFWNLGIDIVGKTTAQKIKGLKKYENIQFYSIIYINLKTFFKDIFYVLWRVFYGDN